MNTIDTPVFPADLMALLGIEDAGTIRRQQKAGKLPAFDKVISRKTRYWHRQTLVAAKILPPHPASANPPTPASGGGAPA